MDLKKKIAIIIGFCMVLSIGSFVIISKMFDRIEEQLIHKCTIEARTGARVMSEIMILMIDSGVLAEKDIFDTGYVKIPGTRPQKVRTGYDRVFDKYIQKIEDEFLEDTDVEYAVLSDKNGYVPTHNSKYSKQETKNYELDLHQSRSKRNFSNFPAIREALGYKGKGTIRLLYYRDTGEVMWNIGAPVYLRGRHWGSFLLGVSLDRINEIKNQMIILIITIMFVIFSLSLLAIISIMPRKMFLADLDDTPNY